MQAVYGHDTEVNTNLGLILFACFVVRQLAVNAANDSAAGSTAAVSSTSG